MSRFFTDIDKMHGSQIFLGFLFIFVSLYETHRSIDFSSFYFLRAILSPVHSRSVRSHQGNKNRDALLLDNGDDRSNTKKKQIFQIAARVVRKTI